MRNIVRIRLAFEELHLEASGITHPFPAIGRQQEIWSVLSSFSTKGSSCVNKRWSRNVQCRVTWDNGACISLKTQLKHMCAYINTIQLHKCSKSLRRPTPTHNKGIVSHSVHAAQSIKTANISLQHIIKIERHYILYASNDASFISKSWAGDLIVSANRVLSISSKVGKKRDTVPSCEKKRGKWRSSRISQMMGDWSAQDLCQ